MTARTRPSTAVLPVLMYHSVSSIDRGPLRALAVPPSVLGEQLTSLTEAGYSLVGVSEALARLGSDPSSKVAALTFDDGFGDFLTDALPVLAAAGATATLYQAVGHVGRPAFWLGPHASDLSALLTWAQLREVASAGVEIGNHSLVHHPLDVLPRNQLAAEVRRGRECLEQELQVAVRSFAYPHGYHTRAVRAAVAQAGHTSACEVGRRLYRVGRDQMAIPRLHVTPDHTGADVLRLVRTGGSRLEPILKDLARPGWRAVRQVAYTFGRTLT